MKNKLIGMKAAVVNNKNIILMNMLEKYNIKIVSKNPNIVISYGGDGTLLHAEELYPGIPKLFLKHADSCKACRVHDFDAIMQTLAAGKYKIKKFMKLEAEVRGKRFLALNDVNIHYSPPQALRFDIFADGETLAEKIIGDGVVAATPHGSHAYFWSITRKTFDKGIGIALNNPFKGIRKDYVLNENSTVVVKIRRGHGVVVADAGKPLPIKAGDKIRIQKSRAVARLIKLRGFGVRIDMMR